MTDSQNKKNEQNCIKQNEKSFIQKDLSLTELWQKGDITYEDVENEINRKCQINLKRKWVWNGKTYHHEGSDES